MNSFWEKGGFSRRRVDELRKEATIALEPPAWQEKLLYVAHHVPGVPRRAPPSWPEQLALTLMLMQTLFQNHFRHDATNQSAQPHLYRCALMQTHYDGKHAKTAIKICKGQADRTL